MEILNKYSYDPQNDLLGKGGFATVYKAYDKVLDMPVALKFFHPQDQANKYTIINEIKRAIILSHPNIVKYYGVETLVNRNFHGQDEEVQIGVMELVQEGQLKTYMSQNPLSFDQLKKLLIDILEGLKYLHEEGIIHRDIKPQNILLGRDKQNRLVAKIADFGISKSADSNQASASILLGTIEYMAPEQFNPERYGINKKISYNVDVWAFGVTAYYLLTGNLLFGSRSGDTSAAEMISKIVNAEGTDQKLLLVDEPFRSVLQKCIVSNANERNTDIDELIAILKGQVYKKAENPFKDSANSGTITHFTASNPVKSSIADDSTQEITIPKKSSAVKAKTAAADDSTQEIQVPVSATKKALPETVAEPTDDIKPKSKAGSVIISIVVLALLGAGGYFACTKYAGAAANTQTKDPAEIALQKIASNFKNINGGNFMMGTNDPKRNFDAPEHAVTVGSFMMNAFEVTKGDWNNIMNDNRYDTTLANYPADSISWNDTKAFITKLNQLAEEKKKQGADYLTNIKQFRLPTDAEWEYACINGLNKSAALNNVSWNAANAGKTSHEVGTKQADSYGIYDMLGNVYEWCEDWYGPYNQESPKQGKVLRGGDYENDVFFTHEKARNAEVVNKRNKNIGFRLAADIATATN